MRRKQKRFTPALRRPTTCCSWILSKITFTNSSVLSRSVAFTNISKISVIYRSTWIIVLNFRRATSTIILELFGFGMDLLFRVRSPLLRGCVKYVDFRTRLFSTLPINDQIYVHEHNQLSVCKSPSAVHIGTATSSPSTLSAATFRPNPAFLPIMHAAVAENIANDQLFVSIAATYPDNYMAIYDLRNPPVYGRIPEVQDILGMVRVDSEGAIVPGTYEKNSMYRLVTNDGVCRFSDYLLAKIREACEEVR
ncbi:hypothetical protein V1506DRAFT_533877 [Lipomyces tetrasporus]